MTGPAPLRKPRFLEGVRAPLLAVVLVAFLLDLLFHPPATAAALAQRALGFALAAPIPILFGMFLGARSWPRRGRRLARHLLKRTLRQGGRPLLFFTDRPDFRPHLGRRVLEVVGFSAGASVILAAILPFLGLATFDILALASVLTLLTLWGSFVLVPYWLFARMGLREVDPVRWLVLPTSRRYADRLRLSNGALLLVALGASVNLAFRAGASGEQALVDGIRGIVGLLTTVFLVAATAAVFYTRKEKALAKEFEEEALAYGVRDGRGMSDGDFLPRLPAPPQRAQAAADLPPLLHEYRPPPPP